ncbi:nitrate- and nitrite sensing domain-containing protein [Streptomyces lasalocidi]
MRFRGKSIRRKIVALLLVPLVSLTAVWAFATVITGREVARLFHATDVVKDIGYPTEDTVRALQQERRQTLVYLADPRAADALAALQRTRIATDQAIVEVRKNAGAHDISDGMNAAENERLTNVLDAFDGLDSLRRGVEQGTVRRAQALDLYNRLVDPCYTLLDGLDGVDDVGLDKQARALVNVTRARELLSREDALLGSSLVVGTLTRDETRDISDLVAQRTLLYDISLPLLPVGERARYERFWRDATTAPLRTAEQSVIATGSGTPRDVTAKSWDAAAAGVLDELGTLDDHAGDRFQHRTRPVALTIIFQAAVPGVLGLIALLFSLFVSVRVGRSLIRDLRQLRLEAHEASGVRLPSVMRRLSAGEQVDIETEAPRLEYDKNEVGEVGQALNTLQRAAVEAAVKQAELRAGVSEVFVNLARRSQVLLHKQLTLLDTMERRTEDTDELADLFRLDHLTTRMRRHAEGLVILSGAAPSRQWRRPVQLMDVVRAAVAEVEDYERVEVRRLPRVAVTGPAVADLTHLVAELLENATVFSPPHTAVQVLGERVANGFTLEIHDRGLGMTAEALLDANLRLAETPEFELSDTDRLGLFVVSRLAQRQNVRVSLQPSPYGGTTAVVFIPDALLSDDVPDTNGLGFRLDRDRSARGPGQALSRSAPPQRSCPRSRPPCWTAPSSWSPPSISTPSTTFPACSGTRTASAADCSGTGAPAPATRTGHPPRPPRACRVTRPVTAAPCRRRAVSRPSWSARTASPSPTSAPAPTPTRSPPPAPAAPRRAGWPRCPPGGAARPSGAPANPPSVSRTAARPAPAPTTRRPGFPHCPGAPGRRGRPRAVPAPRPPRTRHPGAAPAPPCPRAAPRRGRATQPRLPAAAARPGSDTAGSDGDAARPGDPAPPSGEGVVTRADAAPPRDGTPDLASGAAAARPDAAPDGSGPLPRRVRQASLAPQLKQDTARRADRTGPPADRDAEEVRSRMASLQRGWQRGREENAAGEESGNGTAPGTTKGDGR